MKMRKTSWGEACLVVLAVAFCLTGVAEAGFVQNDPIGKTDYLGLKWNIWRDKEQRFARVCTDDKAETFHALGKEIGLSGSAQERASWLRNLSGTRVSEAKPQPGKNYRIPNHAHIDVESFGMGPLGWGLMAYKDGLIRRWEADGVKVIWTGGARSLTSSTVYDHLRLPELYRYAYIGHGEGGHLTGFKDKVDVAPGRYTRHGINEMHLIACESASAIGQWADNVSQNGWVRAVVGELNSWQAVFKDQKGNR